MLTPGEGLVPQAPWTAEQAAFYASLERNHRVVQSWPAWMRRGTVSEPQALLDAGWHPTPEGWVR